MSVLPSTVGTRHLLSLETFECANASNGEKSPVFGNVGRRDVVTDSATIVTALDQNHISAAILDAFEHEPLPPSNPLWTHPKVTISPHVSGLTRGQDVPNLVVDQWTGIEATKLPASSNLVCELVEVWMMEIFVGSKNNKLALSLLFSSSYSVGCANHLLVVVRNNMSQH